jgi:metallo-beta-lactamase family protein
MCDAGRVKHHLKDHLWRGDSTVLFVGYQAPGTLGQLIRSGARTVRIHGEEIAVHARIRTLDLYSGHADQSELCGWAAPLLPDVGHVFLAHGEPRALAALGDALTAAGLPRERLATPAIGAAFALRAARDGARATAVAVPPLATGAPDREAARAIDAGRDWHNDYAEAALALRRTLVEAPDDDARRALLAHVRAVLGVPARPA